MGHRHIPLEPGKPKVRQATARCRRAAFLAAERLEGRVLLAAHIVGDPTVYSNLAAAVSAASAGAVINVDAGTDSSGPTVINKTLTIHGAQGGVDARSNARQSGTGETILNVTGGMPYALDITANDCVIDGFTISSSAAITNVNEAGIAIGANVAGTHIINNIITNQVAGMYLANGSSTDAALIQFNSFTNNNQPGANGGRGIYTDESIFGATLTDVTIDSNYFYGNTGSTGTTGFEAAVAVEPSTTGLASNINVTNNIIDNNGKAVLFFNTNNITFSGNYVTESQDQWSGSVRFEGGDTNVTISNNTIYDNTGPGVAVDSKGTPAPDSGFVLSGNNFYGNSSVWGGSKISVIVNANAYSGAFTATNNWWGSSTGPSGDGSGSGDAIWGNGMAVTAQQWQTASGGSATFSPWSTTPNGTEDAPYRGAPFGAGAPFQAADFNHGGNGIGYSTSATSNAAGQYRPGEDISIENTSDTGPGSFDVTGTAAGQWMDYTINVATTGSYNLSFRVATSQTTGGTFHVMNGAANLTGTMTVPGTGGNQTWQTITSSTVTLNSGTQTLRLMFDTNGSGGSIGNFHWLEFASAAGTPAAPSGLTATAFSSSQINLSWTNNATNQTGFEIDRSLNGTSFSMLTNVAGTVTTYSDMNLNANTSYWYRVEATNAAGKSPSSNVASAVTGLLTPAFSNLSSPTITYGAATTTLSGTISAGTSIPTGNVKITINGAFVNAAINATTGAFSTSFDTHALPVSGSPYTITTAMPPMAASTV